MCLSLYNFPLILRVTESDNRQTTRQLEREVDKKTDALLGRLSEADLRAMRSWEEETISKVAASVGFVIVID